MAQTQLQAEWADRLDTPEFAAASARMMSGRPRMQRDWAAFQAHVVEGKSQAMIAREWGVTPERIRFRCYSAGRCLLATNPAWWGRR